jgi:DNA modification methylase
MNRTSLPVTSIIVQDRQRALDESHVSDLANSIQSVGLIQPIVINQENRLIAGGHRLAAHLKLGLPTIDVVYKETMSEDELQEFELTENIKRKDLDWKEVTCAIMKIHFLKRRNSAKDSKLWGQTETGKLLKVNQSHVSHAIVVARHILDGDKEICACDNFDSAWSVIMRREQELAEAELALRHVQKNTSITEEMPSEFFDSFTDDENGNPVQTSICTVDPPEGKKLFGFGPELPPPELRVACPVCNGDRNGHCEHCKDTGLAWDTSKVQRGAQICIGPIYVDYDSITVDLSSHYIKGDSIPFMLSNPETFDHIITDIPYGIDIENIDQQVGIKDIETIKAEHTVEGNMALFQQFFPAAFTTLKPNAFLITWCDAMQWQYMYDLAISAGFKVQRWPFIWVKDHPCLNQMAQFNFTKSTEFAMVCRKGTITLPEKQSNNYIIASRDQLQDDCQHPFAKPYLCWERLFKAVSMENQKILDPFCGKCSSFISGVKLGRNMYGIEKDEALYNGGLEVLKTFYLKLNPKTNFK